MCEHHWPWCNCGCWRLVRHSWRRRRRSGVFLRSTNVSGDVVAGFGFATEVEGVDVGGYVGLSGVGGDMVVGAGSVLVVKGENVGDGVRCIGVGPIGEGANAKGDHAGGRSSGTGVRERWTGGRRDGRSYRSSRRRNVRDRTLALGRVRWAVVARRRVEATGAGARASSAGVVANCGCC